MKTSRSYFEQKYHNFGSSFSYVYILHIREKFERKKKEKKKRKSNASRDTNYFIKKKCITCWYDEWLLVNEKMMLMVGLNENQLAIILICKNVVK